MILLEEWRDLPIERSIVVTTFAILFLTVFMHFWLYVIAAFDLA